MFRGSWYLYLFVSSTAEISIPVMDKLIFLTSYFFLFALLTRMKKGKNRNERGEREGRERGEREKESVKVNPGLRWRGSVKSRDLYQKRSVVKLKRRAINVQPSQNSLLASSCLFRPCSKIKKKGKHRLVPLRVQWLTRRNEYSS